MLNLNDREWKAFKVKDIFLIEKCKCSSVSTLKPGDFPYVGATNRNNGIMSFVEKKDKLTTKGNCIVFICDGQGSVGYSIYKKEDFIGSTTLKVGRSEHLNRYTAQFLVSALDKNRPMYSYGYKRNENRLSNESIMLPTAKNGQPDYAFMEQYIREREGNLKQKYIDFVNTEFTIPPTPLDKKKWKAFNLISDEMFYIDEVKTFKSTALVEKSGLLDIVGATSKNNGNVGFLPKQYADYLTKGNCICLIKTGQGSVGDALYKKGSFIPSNNVCVIRSSWLNKYNGMFIVAEINKQADRYSYGYIRNNPRIRKEQLMLPTTDSGQPDYNYMEQYIKAIMFRKCKNYLEYQNCLIP